MQNKLYGSFATPPRGISWHGVQSSLPDGMRLVRDPSNAYFHRYFVQGVDEIPSSLISLSEVRIIVGEIPQKNMIEVATYIRCLFDFEIIFYRIKVDNYPINYLSWVWWSCLKHNILKQRTFPVNVVTSESNFALHNSVQRVDRGFWKTLNDIRCKYHQDLEKGSDSIYEHTTKLIKYTNRVLKKHIKILE